MSPSALTQAVTDCPYPKFATLCELRILGAPTLDAVLFPPSQWPHLRNEWWRDLTEFATSMGLSKVMVRTDGSRERRAYIRGGNSFAISDARQFILEVMKVDRAAIVLEPTNRLANRCAISLVVGTDGQWHAETLGSGYDTADLQRGDVPAEFICTGLPMRINQFARLSHHKPNIRVHEDVTRETRVKARLATLATHVLPMLGFQGDNDEAAAFLVRHGHQALFRKDPPRFPFASFSRVFEIGQMTFNWRHVHHRCNDFVISAAVIEDGRLVFWDIVDGTKKWDLRGRG